MSCTDQSSSYLSLSYKSIDLIFQVSTASWRINLKMAARFNLILVAASHGNSPVA
jgi:hypothetical protein